MDTRWKALKELDMVEYFGALILPYVDPIFGYGRQPFVNPI